MIEAICRSIIAALAIFFLIGFVINVKRSNPERESEGNITITDIYLTVFLFLAFLFWITGIK